MKKVFAILIVTAIVLTSAVALTACGTAQSNTAAHVSASAALPASSAQTVKTQTGEVKTAGTTAQDAVAISYDSSDDDGDGTFGNYRSNSELYRVLYNTIQNSGADGYTICSVLGCDEEQLVLSFGSCEADRYYEVYTILGDDLVYVGQLEGSHTLAYIDDVTGTLWMAKGHMGVYSYGPVIIAEQMYVDYSDERVMDADEAYPELTGVPVDFYGADNFTGISMF